MALKEEANVPIYEYVCKGCGAQFEVLVMKQNEKVTCEACGGKKVDRLMSGFAHKSEGGKMSGGSAGGGCASCSSGNCASCH